MGFYSNTNLYIPQSFEELEQTFFNTYQSIFNINSIEDMRQSNIYIKVIKPILQYARQNDILSGGLFDKIIQYIKDSQEQILIYGSSPYGILNVLSELDFVTAVSLVSSNEDNSLLAGQVQIALQYENNEANNKIIADTLLNNASAGIEFLGDIEQSVATTLTGQAFIFKWSELTEKVLTVALTVVFQVGHATTLTQIEQAWFDKFQLDYIAGSNINPEFYKPQFPDVTSISTVFSIDSVAQPADTTIVGEYNVIYTLERSGVVASE
jgi:hypothetical protein